MKFWEVPCVYCGNEIKTAGLDGIDTKKGYIVENIYSCCGWCNTMKLDYTVDDFLKQCKKILSHFTIK